MGDRHFLISKASDETATRTSLTALDGDGRMREIARLTGGGSGASLMHAAELLAQASAFKTSI
jgi:DNA repair protein RecN (Recombination protein N)